MTFARLGTAVTHDAAGHLTGDGSGKTYVYNQAGQLSQVKQGATLIATYYYNYLGERSRKVTSAAAPQGAQTVLYHYDPQGHLIAETSGSGAPLRTYVWRDAAPLAQIEYVPSRRVLYYELDQTNTPRAAEDATGKVVWRWESDAFGSSAANEDPDGDGVKTTVNLRFPGQYYDQESGLHQNYFRDYDPKVGRYVESDPIGLQGGLNTYLYAGGNPISRIDPLGLFFQFSISQQSLTWVDPNTGGTSPSTTWPARSGPWGKGSLPEGWYELTPEEKPVKSEKRSMQDTCGNDYKFRLHPQFSTNRDGLLIHPDGGTPGTMGCIGAQGCTSPLRNFINSGIHGGGGLNVKVVP